jgi:hypothetical protein
MPGVLFAQANGQPLTPRVVTNAQSANMSATENSVFSDNVVHTHTHNANVHPRWPIPKQPMVLRVPKIQAKLENDPSL